MKLELNCTLSKDEVEMMVRSYLDLPDGLVIKLKPGYDGELILILSSDQGSITKILPGIKDKLEDGLLSSKSIDDLDISARLYNVLRAYGLNTLKDIVNIDAATFLGFRNSGKKSLIELEELLTSLGLRLKGN